MGQFEAIAVSTPRSTPGAACGSLLGALVSASMAIAALSSAGVAEATCTSVSGTGADARCTSTQTSFAVRLDKNSSVSAQGLLDGAVASGNRSNVTAAALPNPEPGNVDTASAAANPIAVAESMLGTDAFGPYGCEDFVDAAYGRTTATGIGHDAALAFYQSLANRGLAHQEMPIPRGALVFSAVTMATMSTSLGATALTYPVAYKDFRPVTGTATTCRFCPPLTLARGRCTDGPTPPGRTGRALEHGRAARA